MFSNEDQEAILRYVFRDETNVEMALGVMAARQKIAERVIREFLVRLENELSLGAKKLGTSWRVVNELGKNPFERYSQLYLTKQEWVGLYRVSLGPEKWGAKGFILGVWNKWDTLGEHLDGGKIRGVLEGRVRSGSTSNHWPFWTWAEPYKDWADETTLARLIGVRSKEAAAELSGAMLSIAAATEKIIDAVVQKWRVQHPENETF